MVEGKVAQGDRQGRCQPCCAGSIRSLAAKTSPPSLAPRSTGSRTRSLREGCSNATVNRTLELVRAILRKCVNEWEWLERAPASSDVEGADAANSLSDARKPQRLLAELPEHLADMAAFSLATGLRAANVTGLQWQQVDLTRQLAWIHPDQAKARRRFRCRLTAKRWRSCVSKSGSIRRTCSASGVSRSRRSAPKPGSRRSSAPVSRIFAGMICGTTWAIVARAERHAAVRVAGVGRLGESGDGAPLCAPRRRSPRALCGTPGCHSCRCDRKHGTNKAQW